MRTRHLIANPSAQSAAESRLSDLFDLLERPEWHERAACRGLGHSRFYDSARSDEARAICSGCPVRAQCRTAGAGDEHGIWGGGGKRSYKRRAPAPPSEAYGDTVRNALKRRDKSTS